MTSSRQITLKQVSDLSISTTLLINIGGVGCDNMTCILILFKQSEYAK